MRLRGYIKKLFYGSFPGFSGSFPYFGSRVFFPKNSHLFDRVCAEGIYENDIVSLLWKFVEPNTCYLDVGANIGLLSIPVLNAIGSCRVLSFEPSPNALPFLMRTNEASVHKNRWTVFGQALGASEADVAFCVNESSLGAFDGVRDTGRVKSVGTISVPMTTIDGVLQKVGGPRVSMIKIDVEGSELQVLKGAARCLNEDRPTVLLEWNSINLRANSVNPEALMDVAEEYGYSVFCVKDFIPITSRAALWLQMKFGCENFLLVPEPRRLERRHSSNLAVEA